MLNAKCYKVVCRDACQVLGCFFYHSYHSRSKLGVGESFMHAPRNALYTSVPYAWSNARSSACLVQYFIRAPFNFLPSAPFNVLYVACSVLQVEMDM